MSLLVKLGDIWQLLKQAYRVETLSLADISFLTSKPGRIVHRLWPPARGLKRVPSGGYLKVTVRGSTRLTGRPARLRHFITKFTGGATPDFPNYPHPVVCRASFRSGRISEGMVRRFSQRAAGVRIHLRRPTCHFHFSLATMRRTIHSELPGTGHPNQPEVLPFPPEPASFEIKRNLPELRPPKSQNAVKIVSVIFPVICDKHDLLADCLFA